MPERTFYGGEPLVGARGGEISAGHYDGPEAHQHAPWKCPACGVLNEGPLGGGCAHCGAGQPGYHVGVQPPPPAMAPPTDPQFRRGLEARAPLLLPAAEAWAEAHPQATLAEAFVAGYFLAIGHVAQAPPVTADMETLAPAGKARRTIVAALEIFTDQILSQGPEEITTGEWCSVDEARALIAQLRTEA